MGPKHTRQSCQQESENDLPNFDSDILQNLKSNIEENLKKADKPSAKAETKRLTKARKKSGRAQALGGTQNGKAEVAGGRPSTQRSQSNSVSKAKSETLTAPKQASGKKRLRNGEIKGATPGQKGKGEVNSTKLGQRKTNGTASPTFDLREEVAALGGDDEDYMLVKNVQSDSELEGDDSKGSDGRLNRELKSFVQRLRIANVQPEADLDSEDGSEDQSQRMESQEPHINSKLPPNLAEDIRLPVSTTRPSKEDPPKLTIQPGSEWHTVHLSPLDTFSEDKASLPLDLLERLHQHAMSLLEKENQVYRTSQRSTSSSHQFYSTIMTTGTLSDKIGALTLSVQESPLHNMKALENLVSLARKRSRAQAVEVLGALRDLFGPGNLLPSDRKLKPFETQPGLHAAFSPQDLMWTANKPLPKGFRDGHLIAWAYEAWLKSIFFQVLKIVEIWCNDEVVFARAKAIDYVYSLLKDKPEQEANLLRLLVNKLGDSDKKIASKTSFNILQLQITHPSMKPIIISAIESEVLFRPGQSLHAQYYATITLNQTVLSSREEAVAKELLDIYFSLFLKLLEKPKDKKSNMTGANTMKPVIINSKGEIQGGGGAGGKKAEKKKAAEQKSTTAEEDLRERMLSAVLTGVNRAIPFTNTNDESFEKHLDTLFRVTHSSNFNTGIQALMLIQQLQGSSQTSADRFYRTLYESILDPRLLTSSKQALYLNLLFRSLRSDIDIKRVRAFTKRLLQIISMHQPSFACAVIYLIRELEAVFPSLSAFLDQPEENFENDEEVFKDVKEDVAELPPSTPATKLINIGQQYDGRKRDPIHACASTTTCWELHHLLQHYHPSVSLFASRLLTHASMPPKPDLSLNTLIHFLDRFVYRNPKTSTKNSGTKGVSIMQPLLAGDKSSVLVSNAGGREKPAVNSDHFWKLNTENVGADEVFFHKYFSVIGRGKEKRKEKKAKKERAKKGDESDEDDDGDEEEIWKALVGSQPEVDGVDDGGEEGFGDLEDLGDDNEDEDMNPEDGEDADAHGKYEADDVGEEDDMPDLGDSDSDAALLASDDELPSDLDTAFEAELQTNNKKQKAEPTPGTMAPDSSGRESKRGRKRQRLRNLPTFASAEEYEKMLGGEEEEGVQL